MRKLSHVSNTDPILLTQVSGRKSNPMCVSNTDTRNTTFSSHKFPHTNIKEKIHPMCLSHKTTEVRKLCPVSNTDTRNTTFASSSGHTMATCCSGPPIGLNLHVSENESQKLNLRETNLTQDKRQTQTTTKSQSKAATTTPS